MKIAFVVVLFHASGALADPAKLAIEDATESEEAPLAKREADCNYETGPRLIATTKVAVGKVTFTAVHDCTGPDQPASITIAHGVDQYDAYVGTIRYVGANMTAAPEHLSMLRDRFSAGSFADRTPAVVYRVDLRDDAVCFKPGCGEASEAFRQLVVACTIPTAVTPVPRCTEPATATCETAACAAPTFDRGVLSAGEGRARKRFIVP